MATDSARRISRRGLLAFVVVLLAVIVPASAGLVGAGPASSQSIPAAGGVSYVNISATEAVSFAPNQVTVTAGTTVHLVVTQLADFNHTFTLSPTANFTFPSTDTTADLNAYFHTHTPLVNLSLGSTPGTKYYANFSAPAVGTYEFVCLQDTHFSTGMHGTLTVSAASSSTGSSSSSSFPMLYLILIVVVVVVIAAIVVAVVLRRRR